MPSPLIASTSSELKDVIGQWKAEGLKIGFVPTMGALHEGHMSLVELAKEKTERVVVSLYVNPAQFAPNEDFNSYPRDIQSDIDWLKNVGVSMIYTPSEADIYPDGINIDIKAGKAAEGLETDFRPHFFNGVVTVLRRLFEHVQPDIAVFGKKDYQQYQVVLEMVETLNLPIEILGAATMRDSRGLALSSRNAYLSDEELEIARKLNGILRTPPQNPEQALLDAGFDKVDYVQERWNRRLAATWLGKTRLIDNVEI